MYGRPQTWMPQVLQKVLEIMSDHIVLTYPGHGFHISNMSQIEYVKVQKHCRNQSFLVTIPYRIAKAIPIAQGDLLKAVLDSNNRMIMEKVA